MAVGRRRRKDKHLPHRVYRRRGSYYFVDKDGKWHRLGVELADAYRNLAEFCPRSDALETVQDLADRYRAEMLPSYTVKRQKDKAKHLDRIQAVFGHMQLSEVKPINIRAFRDKLGQRRGRGWERPALANRTIGTLSHMFTMAVEWGAADSNPCREIKRAAEPDRTRYVTDEEFWAVHTYCPPMIQIVMELALLTGLRRDDILSIARDQVTEEGLYVPTSKTGKPLLFEWTESLRELIDRALAINPRVRRYVICNRQGQRYTPDGFSAIWRRARAKALDKGEVAENYRFNDLRAKSASDDADADRASKRLGHTSLETTEKFYIRTPKRVFPLR